MPEVMSIEVDEDFDPRPQSSPFGLRDPEGNLNIGMIAGIVIAIFLVLMLIFVVVKPFGSGDPVATSDWKPNDPTLELNVLASYPVNDPIVEATQAALEDWAEFATTGDLDTLSSTFDLAGIQYAALVKEAPTIAANPEPGEPAIIKLGPVGRVSQTDNIYVIRTNVNWTKPGSAGNTYAWDMTLEKTSGNNYLLSSVKETAINAKKPIDFCTAVGLVSELDTNQVIGDEYVKFPVEEQIPVVTNAFAVRLKSWDYMLEVARGTDDESAVSAIVTELEDTVAAGEAGKTIDEIMQVSKDAANGDNRAYLEERAQNQCSKDISNRS